MRSALFLFLISLFLISCETKGEKDSKSEVLLYLSVREKNYDIFKNDLNGAEIKLTDNPGFDYAPMWNEATKSIIYYSYVKDSFLIANMNLKGEQVPLETYGQQEFNLSPDGQKLISQVSIGDYSALVLSDLEGNRIDTITGTTSYNGRAKWSPASDQIAYISDKDGNNEIYVYNITEGSSKRLTSNETNEKYITWAPTGNKIAYTTQYYEDDKPDRNDVFVLDLVTGVATQITNNEFNDAELAWSPLSDRIAFHSTRDGQDHIYIMNSDGTNVIQITTENAYHGEPEWALSSRK